MAPSRLLPAEYESTSLPRPKKPRLEREETESAGVDDCDVLPLHPLNVKPEGNAYAVDSQPDIRQNAGLFATLPDELLMNFLEYLDAYELLALGSACKTLYAFSYFDDLWRSLFTRERRREFKWLGSWRATYWQRADSSNHVSCHGLYSDVLHRPFSCAHASLKKYTTSIPERNQIVRMKDLTLEKFSSSWSDKPFILTQPVREWPIYGEWTTESLLASYASVEFRAEAVDWPLGSYVQYMRNNEDESPLYLFDRGFADKMHLKVGKGVPSTCYWAPQCFGEDLFALLGDQRPDSRWLIMGPARSGSTFHKDPNATSAWNAVLTGSKYWLMFPSGPGIPTPPGIILSEDASEITSPLSIVEYLMSFHEMARLAPSCLEGICLAGEVLHVPSGWFHLVLNLEDSIAITQNFAPRRKLCDVLSFLRDCPDQISGFKDDVQDAYALFVAKLDESHPQLLKDALTELEQKSKPRKTKWDHLTTSSENQEGGKGQCFSFGFGGADDGDYDDF